MTEHEVCRPDHVGEGWVNTVAVDGLSIALTRVDGRVYAFEDLCSHMDCVLSTGLLSGTSIECDCHGSVFDIRTGDVLNRPARKPIRVFEAREASDAIYVRIT